MSDATDTGGVDTLKAAKALEIAGFDTAQAEAVVALLIGPLLGGAASREDVRYLRLETRADLADLRTELKAEIKRCRSELMTSITDLRRRHEAEST